MGLWTQETGLSWWRTVRFFEHRHGVLRTLEDEGALWAFRVQERETSARLGDANHLLSFAPNHMSGAMLQPDSDEARLRHAMELVVEALAPEQMVNPAFDFQWLAPLEGSYEEVRAAAGAEFLPNAPGRATDLAALVDGEATIGDDDGRQADYILECGIVEAIEAPARLARQLGRFASLKGQRSPAFWQPQTLPDVAFFCDIHWETEESVDSLNSFFTRWEEAREATHGVVSALMDRFHLSAR